MSSQVSHPETLQWYFQQSEINFFPEIKHWIVDDLKKRVEEVQHIAIDQPMFEVLSATRWKKYKPGYLLHFILTFSDGTQHLKTFAYDREQEKWRPM